MDEGSTGASTGAGAGTDRAQAVRRRRRRAWYVYDWANSAYFTTTLTVLIGPYLTSVAEAAACPGQQAGDVCRTPVHVLGVPVAPGSLSLYTVTVATLLSAVLLPLVGAVVDRSGARRAWLGGFAWAGAAAASCMVFVAGTDWQLGVVLLLVGNLCAGASLVVYDALLLDVAAPDERDAVSSRGWALGYLGGALLLTVNLVVVSSPGLVGLDTAGAVRVSLLAAGLWWAGFTLVPVLVLRDLPVAPADAAPAVPGGGGPATGGHDGTDGAGRGPGAVRTPVAQLVGSSFGQLARTVRHLRGYPQTLRFLLAYLVFNDGVQTVIYASGIYGQEELGLATDQLMVAILVVQVVAFAGALAFGALAARVGAKRAVMVGLGCWSVVVVLGYFVPAGRFGAFITLAALIGLVLGGTQALSRSLFSHLVPRGCEAEYFSLYQAAERGTSWLGTLGFGLVFQLTGTYRAAIVALLVFFAVGAALLARVRVAQGVREAGNVVPARV